MDGKVKHVRANFYSVVWRDDDAHGNYSRCYRILAMNAEDAIKATRPESAGAGAVLISVDLLCENIQIRVTDVIYDYFSRMDHADLHPYTNADFRTLLKAKDNTR